MVAFFALKTSSFYTSVTQMFKFKTIKLILTRTSIQKFIQ